MIFKKVSVIPLLVLGLNSVAAQQAVLHDTTTYVDSLNRYYIQTKQPLYLYLSTKPNDPNPTPISNNNTPAGSSKIAPMYLDGNGHHTIQHYDAICKQKVVFSVYADGTAPVTRCVFSGKATVRNNVPYYDEALEVSLAAKDDMSGLAVTYFSINGTPYQPYAVGTKIPLREGSNLLKYYSVDHVGNMEKEHEQTFTIDNQAPVTYHTVTGIGRDNIISYSSIIYLEPTDAVSGAVRTYYHFDDGKDILYNGRQLPIQQLPEGDHTLYYYSVDNVGNREAPRQLKFYLDKSGPIVATDVLGDRFIVNEQVYFSGRTKMKLTSVDNKIGVKETRYSVDGSEFQPYTEPFYLPSKPGEHIIRYYAVDSLNNATAGARTAANLEYIHTVNKIYVDLTGPTLSYSYKGPSFKTRDTTFISSKTEFTITGSDNESGLQRLAYSIDQNPTENPYKGPFTIDQAGLHNLSIIGYDNVNNRNFITDYVMVDNMPPVVNVVFSVAPIGQQDGKPVYPPYVQIFVAPTDDLTGISKMSYSVNGAPERDYIRFIEGFRQEEEYEVRITVSDRLGNTTTQTVHFFVKGKP